MKGWSIQLYCGSDLRVLYVLCTVSVQLDPWQERENRSRGNIQGYLKIYLHHSTHQARRTARILHRRRHDLHPQRVWNDVIDQRAYSGT